MLSVMLIGIELTSTFHSARFLVILTSIRKRVAIHRGGMGSTERS
jgi:hypothetical protein